MSANTTIGIKEAIKYISSILNIELSNLIFIADMENELKKINDLAKFIGFLKERFNYSKYEFKTGEQKLILLLKDYKDEVMYKLSDDVEQKVYDSSKIIFKKAHDFFIAFHEQVSIEKIKKANITLEQAIKWTIKKSTYFKLRDKESGKEETEETKQKHLKILDLIGYEEAYRLAILSPAKLEKEIEEQVRKQAKIKHCPIFALEQDNSDKKVLERISK